MTEDPKKVKITFSLDSKLADELRAISEGSNMNMSQIVEDAFKKFKTDPEFKKKIEECLKKQCKKIEYVFPEWTLSGMLERAVSED